MIRLHSLHALGQRALVPALASLLLLSACDGPPVYPTADPRQRARASRIEGQIVVQSEHRGDVILSLYDANLPVGSGEALTFTVVPREKIFGADLTRVNPETGKPFSGPFTASYSFSIVGEGQYYIRGFMDVDGCLTNPAPCRKADFLPWYGVTAEPNAGDVGGAAVDALSRSLRRIVIAPEDNVDGAPLVPALGISVSFTDAQRIPMDRPSFQVADTQVAQTVGAPTVLTLVPQSFTTELVNQVAQNIPGANVPGFYVSWVDDNADGKPDLDKDGKPVGVWPKVIVRKLSEVVKVPYTDENDLDRNGLLDAEGLEYEPAEGRMDGRPDAVVLAAGIDPTEFASRLTDSSGNVTPTLAPRLRLVIQNQAFNAANPAVLAKLKAVPPGRYAITLVYPTGGTWRLPNELAPELAQVAGLPPEPTQSYILQIL